MKRSISLALSIILIAVCFFAGPVKKAEAPSKETTVAAAKTAIQDTHSNDGQTVVGISMPDRLLERWNKDGAYLRAQFEKYGCKVYLRYANNLIDTQIDDIYNMIEGGADLLVVAAVDGSALSDALEAAHNANIPVIAYDRLIMETEYVDYYVSFDNYKVGVLQAEYLIKALKLDYTSRKRNIEFVTGDPVDNNARYFYDGAMDTLKPYLDSGQLRTLSGQTNFYETSTAQWSSDLAQQRLQIILNSYYPEGTLLDAVLCANDSTALGVVRALDADYTMDNKVAITGQDGDIANIYNILEGRQGMTVFKAVREEGIVTVSLGLAILNGKTPGEDLLKTSAWGFHCEYNTTDYHNGSKYVTSYLLEPISITSSNIQRELFDTGYYGRNDSGLIYAVK